MSTVGGPEVRYGCCAASVGAGGRADIRRRRLHRQARVRERVLDAERERERIAGLRVDDVLHHDPVRPSRSPTRQAAQRTRPWIAFERSGSVSGSW